jgi:hypothetical protein
MVSWPDMARQALAIAAQIPPLQIHHKEGFFHFFVFFATLW